MRICNKCGARVKAEFNYCPFCSNRIEDITNNDRNFVKQQGWIIGVCIILLSLICIGTYIAAGNKGNPKVPEQLGKTNSDVSVQGTSNINDLREGYSDDLLNEIGGFIKEYNFVDSYELAEDQLSVLIINSNDKFIERKDYEKYKDINRISQLITKKIISSNEKFKVFDDTSKITDKVSVIVKNNGKVFKFSSQILLLPSGEEIASDTPLTVGAGNINNDGLFTMDNNWVYYCNFDDNYKLYKVKTDGNSNTKLCDDQCEYINVAGDWVYYCNYSDGGKIYKIKTDGSERTKLNEVSSRNIHVISDWIYYGDNKLSNASVYRVRIDGSENTRINQDPSGFINVSGDWIYYTNYSDNKKIYKMSMDGSKQIKLNDDISWWINVVDDWVYYSIWSDDNRVYKIRTDGSNRIKLNNDSSFYINVCNGWVYYSNLIQWGNLYRMKTDGSSNEKLNNQDDSFNLNIVGNWIYYSKYQQPKWSKYFQINRLKVDE